MKLVAVIRDQPAFQQAFDAQARAFCQHHPGVQIERRSPGIEEVYDRCVRGDDLTSGEVDLALLVTDWLVEASSKTESLDLPNWPDGWHPALQSLVTLESRVVALPYHCGPQVLHFQAELFQDRSLPSTWGDFMECAEAFTQPERGLYGTCVGAFPDGHNNVYDFLTLFWGSGGDFDRRSRPAARKALEMYRGLFDHDWVDPRCRTFNSFTSGEFFAQGHAALMWNWFGFCEMIEAPDSPLKGKAGVAPIPGGAALNVFWAMVIGSGSRQSELAREFLTFLASPESDLLTTEHGAVGARLSTWRNADVLARKPYYGVLKAAYDGSRTLPRHGWDTLHPALSELVESVLGGRQIDDALNSCGIANLRLG